MDGSSTGVDHEDVGATEIVVPAVRLEHELPAARRVGRAYVGVRIRRSGQRREPRSVRTDRVQARRRSVEEHIAGEGDAVPAG
jgi:hypothetical protein